jgi:hypothetical protein
MTIDSEVLLAAYLELFPYIRLETRFQFQELLEETTNLRDNFRAHRNVRGWSTLGLRTLYGNSKFTETESRYGVNNCSPSDFALTEFAIKCPAIMDSVAKLSNIDQCRRVRIMALEPGASIPCHRDSSDPVAILMHIPISYDIDCRFSIGLQHNGIRGPNTVDIPFENGVAMIVNIGSYHSVMNYSSHIRYSVIIEGPPTTSITGLLELARKTHPNFTDADILMRALKMRLPN